MSDFKKWTDIESLSHVIRSRNQSDWLKKVGPIYYRAKIKLHGTNAAIRVTKNGVYAQSRTRVLTVGDDNFGFAAWLESKKPVFEPLRSFMEMADMPAITFFGEWAGPGVQKGVAVSQIPQKTFFLFASEGDATNDYPGMEHGTFSSEWEGYVQGIAQEIDTFKVLPWASKPLAVDFDDPGSLADLAEVVNEMVGECEKVDPYIKAHYGIDGPGEGFVYYPVGDNIGVNPYMKGFLFKAKGEEHRVNKTKSAATVNPELLKSTAAFVDFAVTEARLKQGWLEAVQESRDPKMIPDFLRWVANDVLKECTTELVDAGLEWKQVASQVSKKARDWYLAKSKELV